VQIIKPIMMGAMPSLPGGGEVVRAEAVTAPTTASTAPAPTMAGSAGVISETCHRLAGAMGGGSSGGAGISVPPAALAAMAAGAASGMGFQGKAAPSGGSHI
jgi:hypothetical protein